MQPASIPTAFSETTDLKRDLGLTEAISIVIGRIIGSGIFITPALIMALVGSTSLGMANAALVTFTGSVANTELVAALVANKL